MHPLKHLVLLLSLFPILNALAQSEDGESWALIQNGKALSEIVLSADALPQVKFAAQELQTHLEKMSGAKLPIVEAPSAEVPHQIYVGENKYTRDLGLSSADLKMEGFKIVAKDGYLALFGRDATYPRYPRGFNDLYDVERLRAEWQEYTGEKWDMPGNGLYDPRFFNKEVGFSTYDPTGTLFAVYEFLERQGVRWYSPYLEEGTVIPDLPTIKVATQEVALNPVFSYRFMRWSFPKADLEGFLWFKRQKLGISQIAWFGHGTDYVTNFTLETHPEYRAVVPGVQTSVLKNGKNVGAPRLAAPLRDAMIRFADKFFNRYPEINTCPVAPTDGFIAIDHRDVEAGWVRDERGKVGRLSEYVWTFANDVAKGVGEKHPDKTVMGLSYGNARLVPESIDKLSPNLGVVFCQTRSLEMVKPEERANILAWRKQWTEIMSSPEFYVWEYYLNHADHRRLPGIPVIFSKIMQEDAQSLRGISKGEYVECSYGPGMMLNPALNHYPYMVQARLYWNPDLDLDAFLSEYCTLYYGPAAAEMKEFFTFAEEVWMRPASRDLRAEDSFLKAPDVERYFEILARAKAKTGDDAYRKRIDAISKECEPMRNLFSAQSYLAQGLEALNAKDGEAAVRNLRLAADGAQDSTTRIEALSKLGLAYRDLLKDRQAALDAWIEAWRIPAGKLPPNKRAIRMHAWIDSVQLYRAERKYEEALKLLSEYDSEQARGSWKFTALKAKGDVAYDLGNKEEAIQLYRTAVAVENVRPERIQALQQQLNRLTQATNP